MAAVTTVVEGNVKFREGKKWKSRWCVIKKPSPVADQLQIVLFKNVSESVKRDGKYKSVFTIDSYFGLDASVSYDKECNVLAIVCEKNVFLFAFDQREDMIQFEIKIRQSLGEEHRFLVKVVKAPSSIKIPKDQLSLIVHDTRFCLTALSPPKIILSWNVIDLRRYGLRDGKFCFEGGTSCGKGAGLFALQSDQIETIADIIHYAATGKMSNCHRKFKNRRRPSNSSAGEETLISDRKYATITLPVAHTLEYQSDRDSCPSHSCNLDENSICTSPAKSVLRPRTGKEYVVIRRDANIPTSGLQSPGAVSLSSTQGHIFNYNTDPGKSHQENIARMPMSCHHGHQSSCDCTPKSHHSPVARPNSQSSPTVPSDSETIRSQVSSCHDQKDHQKSIHDHICRARLTSLSVSTLSSLSPSPKTGTSLCQATPPPNSADLSAKLEAHGDSVFFPDEISISTLSDSAQFDDNHFSDEDYHIYVNQEYVFRYQHQNYGSRVANFGSHASASPRVLDMHSHRSSSRDSFAHRTRQRSRHSESDAARSKQNSHSFGPGDRLQKSLTLPSGVHRSHSDPKRGLSSNSYSFHSQNHIHSKKYDKFAQSSIIARRRQQHARANTEPLCEDQPDGLPVNSNVFTSSLQVPSNKTSGYKNIDRMKAFQALTNDDPSQNSTLSDISPSPIAPESQLSAGFSDASLLSCNSHTVMTSTPTAASPTISITPPPIPPRRVSVSSTISPPLTPHTGGSDSPPPYLAPPPPLVPREAALPTVKDDSFSNSSSEEEQEKEERENQGLIYIEVDMTKRQDDALKIPSVSVSRRNRRARQQKDLAKLRYAEIDHTATKALKQTSEKFRDDRRSTRGSSLSHKNSTSSKNRKSSFQTSCERQLSTASIESC